MTLVGGVGSLGGGCFGSMKTTGRGGGGGGPTILSGFFFGLSDTILEASLSLSLLKLSLPLEESSRFLVEAFRPFGTSMPNRTAVRRMRS